MSYYKNYTYYLYERRNIILRGYGRGDDRGIRGRIGGYKLPPFMDLKLKRGYRRGIGDYRRGYKIYPDIRCI